MPSSPPTTRVLKALRPQIMDLVPSASAVVLQVVLQRLPHKRFEKEVHQHFLHSVFRIAESPQGGPIRDGLLLGVIDRLLEVRPPAGSSHSPALCHLTRNSLAQVDVEIKYEDLDDIDDDESGSDVDAVRAWRRCACNDLGDTAPRSTGCSLPARRVAAP